MQENFKKIFSGWQETIIWSCLQGVMGIVHADDEENPRSALARLGDFCFLAGEANQELLEYIEVQFHPPFLILVPQHERWEELIKAYYGDRARRVIRYAFHKELDVFDREWLAECVRKLPGEFVLKKIDGELYGKLREMDWSRDLVSQYPDARIYERLGLGVAVLKDNIPVAGASSYASYRGGIEIEIDTREDCRRQGLACACGAALILACLDRGLYPSWDAQNPVSAHLAEKLGYHLSHRYPAYEICGEL